MKYPYGRRDFHELITEEYVYIDRTHHIRFVEEWGKELLLLRPRRFGKSLWLSTLMNYYDVAKADEFERLFGHLAIGQNPTPLHNQYLVMRWDFSEVKSHGPVAEIEAALHQHVNQWIRIFVDNYSQRLPALSSQVTISPENALTSFQSAVAAAGRTPYKLYLFIDEYDNFANEILMGPHDDNQQRYVDLIKGEGIFKTLFKNIKAAASGSGLDRVYMTGVSPIVMNDATSGANVNEDIYWFQELNDLCGFREDEVTTLVTELAAEHRFPPETVAEAMTLMRIFYNGSWFTTEAAPPDERTAIPPTMGSRSTASHLYNPTLVFYFLRYWQRTGEYPPQMLDRNLQTDANKLAYIAGYAMGKPLIVNALNAEPVQVFEIGTDFGVAEMWQSDMEYERLAMVLCYLGALTINGRAADGKIALRIPNLVMRKLYAERILNLTLVAPDQQSTAKRAADALFAQGDIQPLCVFIEQTLLSIYANRDYLHFNELTLKTLFLSLLYHNPLYIMDSEPAIQRRYGDLSMIIRPGMRHHSIFDLLFEFKYVSLKSMMKKVTGNSRALTGEEVKQMSSPDLAALDAVQVKRNEARSQLQAYRQTLQKIYGNKLKLRTYAVIAVGFERLVWEEVD